MDPASILSLAGACLSLATRTARDLNDLVGKFRKLDQKVALVAAQLNTISATLSRLEAWLKAQKKDVGRDVAKDLGVAIRACTAVIGELRGYVKKVNGGWLGGKISWVWDEGQFNQYQSALDSQIAALGLFLNVIILQSGTQRRTILESETNRRTLREAQQRASICVSTSDGRRKSRSSSIAESSTANSVERFVSEGFSSFTFDEELIDSATYRAALGRIETSEPDRKGKKKNYDVGSPTTVETPSSATSSILPSVFERRSRTDSDALTVNTNSTVSSASTRSSGFRSGSIFDFEKSGRRLSWASRGRQTRLAQELCVAAASGDASTIDSLISHGVDVNCRHGLHDSDGASSKETEKAVEKEGLRSLVSRKLEYTPLHYAAEKGHLEAVEMLISRGADTKTKSRGGRTALHVAGTSAVVACLLASGADPSAKDDEFSSPLHHMAKSGRIEAMEAIFDTPAVVDCNNKLQQTPLHLACEQNNPETVRVLLRAGAYVSAADKDGLRPLHYASDHGYLEIVQTLLDSGADVEARAKDLWRPLHYAARGGNEEVVAALIAADAAVEAATATKSTPLHLAVQSGSPETVAVLLRAGAKPEQETEGKVRPLHLALHGSQACKAIIAALLEHGADINSRLRNGNTPVIEACGAKGAATDVLSTIQCLLDHEGDAKAVNSQDETVSALWVACSRADLAGDIVRLLLAHGARPRHEDFRALWRNRKLSIWEKRAVHDALNEVVAPELRKNEVEWMIVAR